jgi:hypothetical protein
MVELFRPPKVDWTQIIQDLANKGCSSYRIGLTLNVADCTVRNWRKGGEPGYGKGRALLRLHSSYCGAALTTLRVTEGEVTA